MRIERKVIEVTIGDAVLKFDAMKSNVYHRVMHGLAKSRKADDSFETLMAMGEYNAAALECCFEVSGLEHPDGTPVTVDDVRGARLYGSLINEIVTKYHAGSSGAEAKNAEAPKLDSSNG